MLKQLIITAETILLATFATAADADLDVTVGVRTTPLASGRTRYEYTVVNQSDSSDNVSGFEVDVGENSMIKSMSHITGWEIDYSPEYAGPYNPCGPSIEWGSTDPAFELRPGSRAVFSFTSKLRPSSQGYSVYGWNQAATERTSKDGNIAGPGTPVPCETQ